MFATETHLMKTKVPRYFDFEDHNSLETQIQFGVDDENERFLRRRTLSVEFAAGKMIFEKISMAESATFWFDPNHLKLYSEPYLRLRNLKNKFFQKLQISHFADVFFALSNLGFQILNPNSPEESYNVSVVYQVKTEGQKDLRYQFLVDLALDENLDRPQNSATDPRKTHEKKEAVRKVLSAKTVGDIFENLTENQKFNGKSVMEYLKLKYLLEPENNICPGAERAYECLDQVFNKLKCGEYIKSTPIEFSSQGNSQAGREDQLPLVIRVCTTTWPYVSFATISDCFFDVNASILGTETDELDLASQIRHELNKHWLKSDEFLTLTMPRGSLNVNCVRKQIFDFYHFVKMVKIDSAHYVIRAKLFKVRRKRGKEQRWNEWFQLSFQTEDPLLGEQELNSHKIAKQFQEVSNLIRKIGGK